MGEGGDSGQSDLLTPLGIYIIIRRHKQSRNKWAAITNYTSFLCSRNNNTREYQTTGGVQVPLLLFRYQSVCSENTGAVFSWLVGHYDGVTDEEK